VRNPADGQTLVLDEDPNALGACLVHRVVHVVELLDELDVHLRRLGRLLLRGDAAPQVRDPDAQSDAQALEEPDQIAPHEVDLTEPSDQPLVCHRATPLPRRAPD
jgi:hypothetical protein